MAKHMGLMTLRLSNSIVLPINTTHYTYELENYLNRSAHIRYTQTWPLSHLSRVEQIMSATSLEIDLSALREAIHQLQRTSVELDVEKDDAERKLRHILRKWRQHQKCRRLRRKLKKIICRIKRIFGRECRHRDQQKLAELEAYNTLRGMASEAGILLRHDTRLPRHGLRELLHAVKRVQVVNKKLILFERGFISEDGIKDREWYRHLGVAPGKWLGD
jgi:N-acetylated-alpha-linked acidic dipeptidase